jgi:effector-binding domain-containing protein
MKNALGIEHSRIKELYDELYNSLKEKGIPLTHGNGLIYIKDATWTLEEKISVTASLD